MHMPGPIDYLDCRDANCVRAEGGGYASHGSHFGCARCLVWAAIFEVGLVIAVLLCWQLACVVW
jgi:hypothetical protein